MRKATVIFLQVFREILGALVRLSGITKLKISDTKNTNLLNCPNVG